MPELRESLGYRYLQATKFDREERGGQLPPAIQRTERCKTYPKAEVVELPRVWPKEGADLLSILQHRRSVRSFAEADISLQELALLLWGSQGISGQAGSFLFRTAPSAGALYPIETYLAIQRVAGLAPGIYHFDVQGFRLERLAEMVPGPPLAEACLGQGFIAQAPVNVIWTAIFRRNMAKYGHRGLRYIMLDAGHICGNLLSTAGFLGLSGCPVAAFFDDEVNGLLGVDGQEESVVYLASIGRKG
ncbi:SagB/ThcOx family dehydrogenase [Thiovibrio frasassiensis]|uniref:SagB/ThcOx family dehydrogenase n=1 Tax=Thiovibrio frasassiensis TaxID=2984131 RepID=A0A9X4MED9_9BACT|nr:SagB/ThcOx family dehydrogenase [Thiovibrio frasassiensis]MDG4475062.1 SagB/ThcOx family dehydrogenase [Thiovibrio frasassiensis]